MLSILFLSFTLSSGILVLSLNLSRVFLSMKKKKKGLFFFPSCKHKTDLLTISRGIRETREDDWQVWLALNSGVSVEPPVQPGLASCCAPRFTPIASILEYGKPKNTHCSSRGFLLSHSHPDTHRGGTPGGLQQSWRTRSLSRKKNKLQFWKLNYEWLK